MSTHPIANTPQEYHPLTCSINRGIPCHITRIFLVVIGAGASAVIVMGICQFHLPFVAGYAGIGLLTTDAVILVLTFIKCNRQKPSFGIDDLVPEESKTIEDQCRDLGITHPCNDSWEKAYEENHCFPTNLGRTRSKQISFARAYKDIHVDEPGAENYVKKLYVGETYLVYETPLSERGVVRVYNHVLKVKVKEYAINGTVTQLLIEDNIDEQPPLLFIELEDGNRQVFNLETHVEENDYEAQDKGPTVKNCTSYDKERYLTVSNDGTITIFDRTTNAQITQIKKFKQYARKCMTADLRGEIIVIGCNDGKVYFYDQRTQVKYPQHIKPPSKRAPLQVRLRGQKVIVECRHDLYIYNYGRR